MAEKSTCTHQLTLAAVGAVGAVAALGALAWRLHGSCCCSSSDKSYILVTGGSGYIGSHTVLELVEAGFRVVVVDNLTNSSRESIRRVQAMVKNPECIKFHKVDLLDAKGLENVFRRYKFDAVIHFAGLKAVGESVKIPIDYYEVNLVATLNLLKMMKKYDCKRIAFSSSATVYGDSTPPFTEATSQAGHGIPSPYGKTKYTIEMILEDAAKADPDLVVAILRYFNPVGAHPSGKIGENPLGVPNNLMPYIQQVAVGRRDHLSIFGTDYDTRDGTPIRDYIHVVDLAQGHVKAIQWCLKQSGLCEIFNLGTGNGHTVFEVLHGMEKAVGKKLPHKIAERREGDVPVLLANATKAKELLGWEAKYDLERMCKDTWRWVENNPYGYAGKP